MILYTKWGVFRIRLDQIRNYWGRKSRPTGLDKKGQEELRGRQNEEVQQSGSWRPRHSVVNDRVRKRKKAAWRDRKMKGQKQKVHGTSSRTQGPSGCRVYKEDSSSRRNAIMHYNPGLVSQGQPRRAILET